MIKKITGVFRNERAYRIGAVGVTEMIMKNCYGHSTPPSKTQCENDCQDRKSKMWSRRERINKVEFVHIEALFWGWKC